MKGSSVKINRCIENKWNSLYFKFVLQFDENIFRMYCSKQARRQDSVTGGGGGETERNFGGAREVYSSMDQTKKVKTKKRKKGLRPKISTNSGCRLKILAIFDEIWSEDQKKRSSSQNLNEIRRKFTKITKTQFLLTNSRAVNTGLGILGLDLHSSSLEPVNFFGAQSSLGGHKHSFGGHGQECPLPLRRAWLKVIRSCFGISLITLCVLFSLSFVYLSGLPTKMRDDQ